MNIQIRQQKRQSLALRLTPDGATVLIPFAVGRIASQVKSFIAEALAKLPDEPD